MNRYPFKTKCPVCCNNEVISWHHDGCAYNFGETIDILGYIKCDYCSREFHMIDGKYDCGNVQDESYIQYHKNKYESIRYCRLWMVLGSLGSMNNVPDDFIDTCIQNVTKKYNK